MDQFITFRFADNQHDITINTRDIKSLQDLKADDNVSNQLLRLTDGTTYTILKSLGGKSNHIRLREANNV